MIIKSHLRFGDYYKLMLGNTYKNNIVKFISILGLFMFSGALLYYLDLVELSDEKSIILIAPDSQPGAFFRLIFGAVLLFFVPVSAYSMCKKHYNSGEIRENMVYEFSDQDIKISGESFYYQSDWSKIHKVKENKNYFLIYPKKNLMNIIPKSSLSKKEVAELQQFFLHVKDTHIEVKS